MSTAACSAPCGDTENARPENARLKIDGPNGRFLRTFVVSKVIAVEHRLKKTIIFECWLYREQANVKSSTQ